MLIVTKDKTALEMGSGDLEVFATPAMVALMENVAMNEAKQFCQSDETTVGIAISVNHTRATPIGEKVRAEAKLVATEGRKLTFNVIAFDQKGEIGNGKHERFIVNKQKFLAKL